MKKLKWNGRLQQEAVDILSDYGGMIVCPTKVGYIILSTDKAGLERTFDAKQRSKNKPGVVICGSLEQLKSLAVINPEIEIFYRRHWDDDCPLGCILPWREDAISENIDSDMRALIMDKNKTSCFIIRPGVPCELIVDELWKKHRKISFASSANPSGGSNKGKAENIGQRIEDLTDLIIVADDYVYNIQPEAEKNTRHEQSVMVSMVDNNGSLVPEQNGENKITPCPVLIRKGLNFNKTQSYLSDIFNSWEYRNGGVIK